jgi:RNA polymerase sigma-70 factor (ECF subfamily)
LRFVWRLIRRIGLAASDADDVTQRVFSIAVQRIESIQLGSERAFLYRTAVRLAIRFHASNQRQRKLDTLDALESLQDPTPSPDTLLDQQRARQLFDQILASMALELRTVIILFELENLTLTEIADTLGIPRGTAASRLRRAREEFDLGVRRIETRLSARRGVR